VTQYDHQTPAQFVRGRAIIVWLEDDPASRLARWPGTASFADFTGDRVEPASAFQTGFAKSKTHAVDPEITRNQKHDNHDANDGKDVHFALLPLYDDGVWCVRTPYIRCH